MTVRILVWAAPALGFLIGLCLPTAFPHLAIAFLGFVLGFIVWSVHHFRDRGLPGTFEIPAACRRSLQELLQEQ